ncbi:tRNA (N6-isopentenyl adenosine(37)-C2)-methylthiotransferase MiaB [bacterium]|nr:tRNA (N6-isopentenyl adenosine(37)-C2)-methylthiotransferase MiaB [bacterium]
MNEHDSSRMATILEREGYDMTDNIKDADLVLINTCSVRENPENKVYSLLGRLSRRKRGNPDLIVGVAGCVAQQEGKRILKREKSVDLVFGPDTIFQLPEMLAEVESGKRVLNTDWMARDRKIQNFIPDQELTTGTVEGGKGQIAITKGCNNFCSFCIVPITRGRLVSRQKENILSEAMDLIAKGAKEIHLLGQNVNSYSADQTDFYRLLETIANLDGLKRLRFISPHPNDWNNDLTDLVADHPVICKQIHLPFQSGSDRILELMKRGHSAQTYLKKIEYLQNRIKDIAITTDVIVGFPGESEKEFTQTLKMITDVRFNQIYSFKYSTRPGTKAALIDDDVPKEIKEERLERLLQIQSPIQSDILAKMLNSTAVLLIESVHPKERGVMNGRTDGNTPVSVANMDLEIGDFVEVKIIGCKRFSLVGEVIPK